MFTSILKYKNEATYSNQEEDMFLFDDIVRIITKQRNPELLRSFVNFYAFALNFYPLELTEYFLYMINDGNSPDCIVESAELKFNCYHSYESIAEINKFVNEIADNLNTFNFKSVNVFKNDSPFFDFIVVADEIRIQIAKYVNRRNIRMIDQIAIESKTWLWPKSAFEEWQKGIIDIIAY